MFRNFELRRYGFFAASKWQGGFYCTTSIAGSRNGAIIAGTWTAMMRTGYDKYKAFALDILTVSKKLKE